MHIPRGTCEGVTFALECVEGESCEPLAAEGKIPLDILVGAVEALDSKQVDKDAVEVDVPAAEKTNGRADTGHVGCQGIVIAHFEVSQLATVVHEGEVASRGVCVSQDGHHFKPFFDKAGAHVKT